MMLAQEVQVQTTSDAIGWLYAASSVVLLVVGIVALIKFFQLASDVRSILRLLLAESEARDLP
jgi:hypothetical protein